MSTQVFPLWMHQVSELRQKRLFTHQARSRRFSDQIVDWLLLPQVVNLLLATKQDLLLLMYLVSLLFVLARPLLRVLCEPLAYTLSLFFLDRRTAQHLWTWQS